MDDPAAPPTLERILRGVDLFRDLPDDAVTGLLAATREVVIPAGQAIVREDDAGDALYIILDGVASVLVHGRPRRDMGAGDTFGEIALLDGQPRSASVYAVTAVRALMLAREVFDDFVDQMPGARHALLVGVCRRLRQLEDDRWAQAEERRLRELQAAFLANVSHELRTPLATALGFVQLARTGELDEERQATALASSEGALQRLRGLIDDLIGLARSTERGTLAIAAEPLSAIAAAAAEEAGLGSSRLRSSGLDALVVAVDGPRVTRTVAELLTNASKHGPEGGVIRLDGDKSGLMARLDVVDEGPGIAVDAIEEVFAGFHQADATRTRPRGGLGIGLSLARTTARLHGGDLVAVPGAPTRFRLTLPLAEPAIP
ncbi:MAG: ATP-binding protein [Nitriliruptorales bacterium]